MRSYQTGIEYYFREIGQKVPAGTVIELRQGDAERYMLSHPGLLKPLPVTAQARPPAVRAESTPAIAAVPAAAPEVPADEPASLSEVVTEPAADATEVTAVPAVPAETEPVEPAAVEPSTPAAEPAAATPGDEKGEAKPKGKARAKK